MFAGDCFDFTLNNSQKINSGSIASFSTGSDFVRVACYALIPCSVA